MKSMNDKIKKGKLGLYATVFILAVASLGFRFLNESKLEQTSLLFVGLPALVTLLVIRFTNKPKSLYGAMARVITLFLLMSSILLGEGTPCIILASPLFYGVGALIIFLYKIMDDKNNRLYSYALIPALLVLIGQPQKFKSTEIHTVSTSLEITGHQSLSAFNQQPDFMQNFPTYFKRVSFPKPIGISGEGLKVGDYRNIDFVSDTRGLGTLSLRIIKIEDDKIVFDIPHDNTHMHHWMTWKKVTVELAPQGNNTLITWKSEFTCDLGPNWCFLPIEKYTVDIMHEHLINSYFK